MFSRLAAETRGLVPPLGSAIQNSRGPLRDERLIARREMSHPARQAVRETALCSRLFKFLGRLACLFPSSALKRRQKIACVEAAALHTLHAPRTRNRSADKGQSSTGGIAPDSLDIPAATKSPNMPPSPLRSGQPDGALSEAKKAGATMRAAAQYTNLNLGLTRRIPGGDLKSERGKRQRQERRSQPKTFHHESGETGTLIAEQIMRRQLSLRCWGSGPRTTSSEAQASPPPRARTAKAQAYAMAAGATRPPALSAKSVSASFASTHATPLALRVIGDMTRGDPMHPALGPAGPRARAGHSPWPDLPRQRPVGPNRHRAGF